MLRRDGERIGIDPHFVIYDTDDQMSLVRTIETELDIDQKRFTPRAILSAISSANNERRGAAAYQGGAPGAGPEAAGPEAGKKGGDKGDVIDADFEEA